MIRLGRGAAAGLVGAALLASAAVAQPAGRPETDAAEEPPVVLPLAQAPKQPLREHTLAQLKAMFPAFEHEPFATAGFNHLSLPFHYEDRDGGGDANEANAFTMLLSESLDWGPGCYCGRHAYFVFKRARWYMLKLARQYDAALIRYAIKDWQATHAVGGTLVHHRDGHSGTLVIYGREGQVVKKAEFRKPRDISDLLGDMAVEALIALGHTPSKALADHLHIRRCKHRQSLIDLGKAAWIEERSKEEFALYDAILKRDPGFADVWFWRGNQRWWMSYDLRDRALHDARALAGYLQAIALRDFLPGKCPDKALAARYGDWLMQAEQMLGPEAPLLVKLRLDEALRKGRALPEFLTAATRVAARYPNDYWMLYVLGRVYTHGRGAQADCDMGVSIHLAALQNNYMTGRGHKHPVIKDIAANAQELGHNDVCVHLLLPVARAKLAEDGEQSVGWAAWMLGKALFEMGHFDRSWRWYRIAFKSYGPGKGRGTQSLVEGAVSAAHAGRVDVVRQILRDRRKVLDEAGATGLVRGYLELLAGKRIDHKAAWSLKPPRPYWLERHLRFLTEQSDLLHHKDAHWRWPEEWLRTDLYCRPRRVLGHGFFQRYRDRAPDTLYVAMEWLCGDDPWTKQAVGQWRARVSKPRLPDPDELLRELKDYEPVRWPVARPSRSDAASKLLHRHHAGTYACGVRRLLEAGRLDEADELAKRYLHLVTDANHYSARVHANHLVHRVAQARRAAKGMIGPDDL